MPHTKNILAAPSSDSSQADLRFRSTQEILRVKFKQKPIHMVRFLLQTMIFEERELTTVEEIVLWTAWEKSMLFARLNPEYDEKWNKLLEAGYYIVAHRQNPDSVNWQSFKQYVQNDDLLRHHFEPRTYFGVKDEFANSLSVRIQSRYPKRLPEPSRIAVGYRDKGNCKNSSVDGSPSWQEVASSQLTDESKTESSTPVKEPIDAKRFFRRKGLDFLENFNRKPPAPESSGKDLSNEKFT